MSIECPSYPELEKKKHLQTVHKQLICNLCLCLRNDNDNDIAIKTFLHTTIFTVERVQTPTQHHDGRPYYILNELSDTLSAFPDDVRLKCGLPRLVMEMCEGKRLNAQPPIPSDEDEFEHSLYANISFLARDLEPQGISFHRGTILAKLVDVTVQRRQGTGKLSY